MSEHSDYAAPLELKSRGIERLSVVYGIVPVHEDGRPLKQYKFPLDSGERATGNTPRKVAKGLVEQLDTSPGWEIFEDVKVSWQQEPLGRLAISRGVSRWPSAEQIFTAGEIAGAVASDVIESDVYGYDISEFGRGLIFPDAEGMQTQLDQLVKSEMGNMMLRAILTTHTETRFEQALSSEPKSLQ
jgi:hypothetical protein